MDATEIINYFYPESPLRQLLLHHSEQVKNKALAILSGSGLTLDRETIEIGAMLHDIGIYLCHAPKIKCYGTEKYIMHGILGAKMLRDYASKHQLNLDKYANICECHTGSGITIEEIKKQVLPLPLCNYLPQTLEEKLICLADKFFSKSGAMQEKSITEIRHSLTKFGVDSVTRFDDMCKLFSVENSGV